MKIYKNNKYKVIVAGQLLILSALLFLAPKKNSIVDDNVLASTNNITYEQNSNNIDIENAIDVNSLTASINKTEPTIVPTPTITPTPTIAPTPTPMPKVIWYPTPGPNYNPEEQTDKLVALTFDDGPNSKYTLKVLEVLKKYNCTATFFVVGEYAKANPDIVKEVYDAGMEIGSHSNDHENFKKLTEKQGIKNLKTVSNILKKITGKYPLLFRPPGGNYNDLVRSYSPKPICYWANDSLDYDKSTTDKQVISNATVGISNGKIEGKIILMHDRVERTVYLLDKIIPMLQKKGYKITSVSYMYDYYDVDLENNQVYAGVKLKK
jgi:peptidoglycan/xylan/chitin deacetylase (PgdA/CDA1 family)